MSDDAMLTLEHPGGMLPHPTLCRYGTFARLAGEDPTDHAAAAANLPAVDSIDMWPYLSGTVPSSPRKELVGAMFNSLAQCTECDPCERH